MTAFGTERQPVVGAGKDLQALPVSQPAGKSAVLRGQVADPLAGLRDVVARGQGKFLTLLPGSGFGFGGTQRGKLPARVPAVQFGVGGADGGQASVCGGEPDLTQFTAGPFQGQS